LNGAKHQESLGKRLKRLRTEKNLSVKDVAEALEVPVTTYREWENERKIVGEPIRH
jgi:transcriptional regulator with XRE-family HTH domain